MRKWSEHEPAAALSLRLRLLIWASRRLCFGSDVEVREASARQVRLTTRPALCINAARRLASAAVSATGVSACVAVHRCKSRDSGPVRMTDLLDMIGPADRRAHCRMIQLLAS